MGLVQCGACELGHLILYYNESQFVKSLQIGPYINEFYGFFSLFIP